MADDVIVQSHADILTIIATVIVTLGVPAIVGQLWRLSVQTARIGQRVEDIDFRVKALEVAQRGAAAVMLVIACLGAACGDHAKAITRGAAEVSTEAASARSDLDAAVASGDVGPRAMPGVTSARGRLGRIEVVASGIGDAATHVQDRASWFERMLGWWWLIPVGLVILAALYTFAPAILARIVTMIPAALVLLPRAARDAAKLAREAMQDPRRLPEFVAAHRAASPTFDAAFRVQKGGG